MIRFARVLAATCLVLLGPLLAQPALAAFPEKNIEFIIPYSPGGGFDTYVRKIAPVMEKYLPGDVKVVPRNLPGAAGRKGAAYIYRADPDGYTIGIFNLPGMLLPAIQGKQVGYDLTKMTWLGRIATNEYVLVVPGASDAVTVEDLRELDRPVKMLSMGFGTTAYTTAAIAAKMLDLDASLVTGFKGMAEVYVGVMREDGDATVGISSTVRKYVDAGDIKVIASFEEQNSFPNAQSAEELGEPRLTNLILQRMIGAPPGVPDDVREVLATALAKALEDPELVAWSKSSKRPLAPLSGDAAAAKIREQMTFYSEFADLLEK